MAGKTVVLDGDCQLIIPSAGELGVVTAIRKPYPTYTGETTVTPSDEAQVLHTELQTLINDITVEAVPGDYVGSDIPRRDSSDVAASGATVTAPAGYYEAEATKTIQSGTEGTPIATKGAVSNHAVSVTPSVTNTEGYISGGTKSGTAVTVSASELVSGTKEITENGSGIDVANYAAVDVAVPSSDPNLQSKTNINPTTSSQTIEADPGYDGLSSVQINAMPNGTEGTPTAAKSAVSNHSVSVTPSVTNTAGYISGGTKTGTPVTVTAAELESGTKAITANGSGQDVTGYAAVDVNVPNSYTASDEGKVVNNGALVAQTSATYTNNGTYDTTLKNSVTVDVPSQTPVINPLSVTANGTYSAPAGVDGYSPVTVNVSGGGSSNFVMGLFTPPTGKQTQFDINIPYAGNGYPVGITIIPEEGAACLDGAFYNTVDNGALSSFMAIKCDFATPPTYTGGSDDTYTIGSRYKRGNSTLPGDTSASASGSYATANATGPTTANAYRAVAFKSKNVLSVYIKTQASGIYAFLAGFNYRYYIIYSE